MVSPFLSAGVYTREVDLSLYVPALSTTAVGCVGTASWGPMNARTLITDGGTLFTTFGPPSSDHLGLHCAERYLRDGNQLFFVRVGTYDRAADGTLRNEDDDADSVLVTALYTGIYGNELSIKIEDGTTIGSYKLSVMQGSLRLEVFDNLRVGTAYVDNDNYIETQINGISAFIVVDDFPAEDTLRLTTVGLVGGADGAPASEADVIGTTVGQVSTGLQLFQDSEEVESGLISIVMVPGRWERAIVTEIQSICEQRQDLLGLIDPPDELTVQEVVAWHNGELTGHPDYLTAALNSSYLATYYPYVQVFDSFNDVELYLPPSGHAAGIMARTDITRDPWFAPAGLQRGRLSDVLDTRTHLSQGSRDFMYSGGNAINPIPNFVQDGVVIWGQRTLQRATTALDRVNVRRMLIVAKKAIATAARFVVFEPNDPITYRQLTNLVNPFLRNIQARRGLIDFQVICDITTNPPAVTAQNRVICRILLIPTLTAEVIELEFVLLPQGSSFAEFSALAA